MADAAHKKMQPKPNDDELDAEGQIDSSKASANKQLKPGQAAAISEKKKGQAANSGNAKYPGQAAPKGKLMGGKF